MNAIPEHSLKWHYDAGAFGHISVSALGLVVAHYSSKGKKLYEAKPVPPWSGRETGQGHAAR
jgi:hypothetical protein